MAPLALAFSFDKSATDPKLRQIWGYATLEEPDKQGDIVDYDGSVEAFGKWVGNIREQHDPKKAIGKAFEIRPDSNRRGIWLGAQISHSKDGDDTWTKIEEGVLNGFSIKGDILESQPEMGKGAGGTQRRLNRIKKYRLDEVSVVDNPACPSAMIEMVKSQTGGLLQATDILVPFHEVDDTPDEQAARIAAKIIEQAKIFDSFGRREPPPPVAEDSSQKDVSSRVRYALVKGYSDSMPLLGMGYSDLQTTSTVLGLMNEWIASEKNAQGGDADNGQLAYLQKATAMVARAIDTEFGSNFEEPLPNSPFRVASEALDAAYRKALPMSGNDLDDIAKIYKRSQMLVPALAKGVAPIVTPSGTEMVSAPEVPIRSYSDQNTSDAPFTTPDGPDNRSVPHNEITPQFAADIHELSTRMGAICNQYAGPQARAAVPYDGDVARDQYAGYGNGPPGDGDNDNDSVPDASEKAAGGETARRVPAKQGFAQDLHDQAVQMGASCAPGPASMRDPGYGKASQTQGGARTMLKPGDLPVDKAIQGAASAVNFIGKAATAANPETEDDVEVQELVKAFSPQFAKMNKDTEQLAGVVGSLADLMQKSTSTLDALAARVAKIEGQPESDGGAPPVRQPTRGILASVEKSVGGSLGESDDPEVDEAIAVVDNAIEKCTDHRQYERLGFQRGRLEILKAGTFRGWAPPSGRPNQRTG